MLWLTKHIRAKYPKKLHSYYEKLPQENVIPTSSPNVSGSLSEKLSSKKKVMSWKEKIGQTDKKPSGSEDKSERKPSKDEDKTGTPSRKRPRSDEVFVLYFPIFNKLNIIYKTFLN